MSYLKEFINKYCRLEEEDLATVLSKFQDIAVKKGRHVLRPGQICSQFYFVKNGTLRIYLNDSNNREITAWLALEKTFAIDSLSFYTQTPSQFYIHAISDSTLAVISFQDLEGLYQKIPHFQQFGRKLAEELAMDAVLRAVSFQKETAEKRYEQIVRKPEYMQNVLLKHLASFLGLTDSSLSRLRRKR